MLLAYMSMAHVPPSHAGSLAFPAGGYLWTLLPIRLALAPLTNDCDALVDIGLALV